MKIFVFDYVEQVSSNYHSEGGLMVIADSEEHVKELVKKEGYIEITKDEWSKVIAYELKNNEEPRVFVFPDAGCC